MSETKYRIVEMTVAQYGDGFLCHTEEPDRLIYVIQKSKVEGIFRKRTSWENVDFELTEEAAANCILWCKGEHPHQLKREEALQFTKKVIWEEA